MFTHVEVHSARTSSVSGPVGSVTVPRWAFRPDNWSTAFLRGLTPLAQSWAEKRVWEVGVGTGANVVALHGLAPRAEWHFSDYDRRCVPLALKNCARASIALSSLRPLAGSWDLVRAPHGRRAPAVDVLFGCLPQVPAPKAVSEDDLAHYYDPSRYVRRRSGHGLALNETLLRRAKKKNIISRGGQVILNLSGRPGKAQLLGMFASCGYTPVVVHEEIIAQHPHTSLRSLVSIEEECGMPCEFFADVGGTQHLSADEAEQRRLAGEPVFHKIYVVAGTLH